MIGAEEAKEVLEMVEDEDDDEVEEVEWLRWWWWWEWCLEDDDGEGDGALDGFGEECFLEEELEVPADASFEADAEVEESPPETEDIKLALMASAKLTKENLSRNSPSVRIDKSCRINQIPRLSLRSCNL